MGALLHFLKFAALFSSISTDTSTYADQGTKALVTRAMARHVEQDSSVRDYTAKLRYRVSFGLARRKWGDPVPMAVEEQAATVAWQYPNDLRVNLLGRRSVSQLQGIDLSSTFAHPWFVPRTLGDSLRMFGASETPSRAAPHPLAPGADRYYRYAAGESVQLTTSAGQITIQSITVTPKYADGAFIAGRLWVDVATGDVVRLTFRFVGTELWSVPDGTTARDSAAALRDSKMVSRFLELNADLEFSLQNNAHWMPYRQVIAGKISMPLGIDFAVPFEAQTTFDDYTINSGARVAFDAPFPRDTNARGRNRGRVIAGGDRQQLPDSVRARLDSTRGRRDSGFRGGRFRNRTGYLAGGGRYEIHRPPADSMRRYSGWGDSLVLQDNPEDHRRVQQAMADLAHITEALPGDMTGRPGIGVAWQKVSDILRYNRVQGTALSLGGRVPLPIAFADLYATAGYGFADQRITGRLALVRDAPAGRLTVTASRDLADDDPYARGLTFGNSLRAIFTGHDDGAYLLAQGLRASYETSRGVGTDLTLSLRAEDERSVSSDARAFFPRVAGASGFFPANTPIREGFATGAGLQLEHAGPSIHWMVDGEGIDVAGAAAARLASELRFQRLGHGWVTLRLKGAVAIGADSVPQLGLQAGGLNTVRGYDFGVERGDALWSTQLDISKPGRSGIKVVEFIDAGQAGDLADVSATPVLSGAGVGLSVLGGLVRADLSHPLTRALGHGFRFDLIFGAVR